jgi:hypothetical protein
MEQEVEENMEVIGEKGNAILWTWLLFFWRI